MTEPRTPPPGRGPAPGDPAPPPVDPAALPDDAPASVGQLRSLRRWVAVAGVWAVAATAVALIALIDGGGDDEPRGENRRTAAEIGELQRTVDERIGELEEQVENVASSEDVERLDQRLQDLEGDVSSASESAAEAADAAETLSGRVDELESRVEALEDQGGGGNGGGGDQP